MTNITHEFKANVGDKIRSYDFKPMADRGDCWVEGIVIEKGMTANGWPGYTINVTKRMWSGEIEEFERDGVIPTMTPFQIYGFGEFENRITKVEAA